jgi:hypothetical protein
MIKGKKFKPHFSIDEIMMKTNGGYDIYMYYLGAVKRIMPRPWGKKERHPSWGLKSYAGIWNWKDHATEESGNAIQFVERYFGLSFTDALAKIAWDFGIPNGELMNVNPVKVTWETPYMETNYVHIGIIDQPFKQQHHKFWNIAEVSESHCNKMNCWAVKSLAINRKRVNIRPDEAVFAYVAPEEKGYKIYFPERERENRFRNNVSYHYLWNYENLEECEDLIIQKSPKDMIVTSLIQPCVTSTQNESIKVFDEETVQRINKISKRPWVWYGSDDDGVRKCKEITDCNKWRYVNTPKNLLPDINDTYSYTAKYKLKGLEEFMKLKKLIK